MIDKYYIIVTKDKDGFTVPYTEKGKPPELFLDQNSANAKLQFIRNCYQTKIDYVPDGSRFSLFRKTEMLPATEEQKKEMRWFIENSKIQGVILKV
ncbi:hypothetical protein BI032_gp026 [Citrobacter phage vB_CfrM_CfP1]|uniref:Uncharacterized protein n=1 Tax=Citrobacter phage vB_CfrM_CfP1 TaxID=1871313 RepID=A0A1B1IXQ4_9CAUD|nr:hypothetical protein BI032_gp026 [Citrobacter phage vB_CfrM_CfP1]ANS06104.1 hypothetical protein ABCD_0026 [Citrobacter phage vB_CfrM_CfP1]